MRLQNPGEYRGIILSGGERRNREGITGDMLSKRDMGKMGGLYLGMRKEIEKKDENKNQGSLKKS